LFSTEWYAEHQEDAEAQAFWNEFFNVFGVRRRTVASFEEKVRNIKGQFGFIDLFWRGKLLAEHKSRGKSLDKAASQAFEYIQCLKDENRDDEIPRYVIVSDFATIILYDLEADEGEQSIWKFPIQDLHKHIHAFAFIPGYKIQKYQKEDPANVIAAELMGNIHDTLADNGYSGHLLERFLVRILFCLFAEDTGIFEPNAFTIYLEQSTREDGSDFGVKLVKEYRLASQRRTTRELAKTPTLFGEIRQPKSSYVIIPRVSSERRHYIPIDFLPPKTIASDATLIVPKATLFHFGILTSTMHMNWMRQVCGRLEIDYRYSAKIVYNNFPFPQQVKESQQQKIEKKAQRILDVRKQFSENSLAT
jgi:hypothetical protein